VENVLMQVKFQKGRMDGIKGKVLREYAAGGCFDTTFTAVS